MLAIWLSVIFSVGWVWNVIVPLSPILHFFDSCSLKRCA